MAQRIIETAEKELKEEAFKLAVEKAKVKIMKERGWKYKLRKLFPYRIVKLDL